MVLLSRERLEGKGQVVGVGRCGGAATSLAHLGSERGAVPSCSLCSRAVCEAVRVPGAGTRSSSKESRGECEIDR